MYSVTNSSVFLYTYNLAYTSMYVNRHTSKKFDTVSGRHTYTKMQVMSYFGEKLREARQAAKLTQEQLAALLGIARTNYIPYETGKKFPSEEIWPQLSEHLGVSLTDIKAWRIIDEHGKDVVLAAASVYFPENTPEGREIRAMLSKKSQAS